ncbi:MAG TPA: DUF3052 family protein [Acidimicrobiales bacterium]|nr:DUF3052 family protein [Acidimicrobiales bacterium]
MPAARAPSGGGSSSGGSSPSGNSGSSGTPLARKLGIHAGDVVALVGAPRDFDLPDLPDGVRVRRSLASGVDVVIAFVRRASQLPDVVARVAGGLDPGSALWLCWPRRAAGHNSDITDDVLRHVALPTGLVDVKVAAVGEDWSGLRFVWRTTRRV